MFLSVIIPARNEEVNIPNTLRDVYSYLTSKNIDHEILVIENNSTDKTVETVEAMKAEIPSLTLVHLELSGNRAAKGFAVRDGMLRARGDFRLFMDADNATNINNIEHMLPFLTQGYDVVIGSIALKGAVIASGSEPAWRRLFGKLGNLFIQIMAVPGIHDTQRGFKVFSERAVSRIFAKTTIYGWGFDIEVLALARKFGYKIKEVPVKWNNDIAHSKVTLSAYREVLWETVVIRWNLMTGKYN